MSNKRRKSLVLSGQFKTAKLKQKPLSIRQRSMLIAYAKVVNDVSKLTSEERRRVLNATFALFAE